MTRFDPGEGPAPQTDDDIAAAHDRAIEAHAKHLQGSDPRDADTDLDDPQQQETQP